MAKSKRILIRFACTVCKFQNYTKSKNPENASIKKSAAKLTLKKFCKKCRKTTEHKEIKI